MKNRALSFIFLAYFFLSFNAFASENVFYILRSNSPGRIASTKAAINSLEQHAKLIDVLVTQSYMIDSQGVVSGYVDPKIIDLAKKHNIPIMLLVTNTGFSKEVAKKFLSDPVVQKTAVDSLVRLCEEGKYYGLQMDFENIPLSEKDKLTQFYTDVSNALHSKGFKMSVAIVPLTFDGPPASEYLKRKYENWAGGYDLKALSNISEFISIMTYDQHGGSTTPGPYASFPYMKAAIKHTLQFVPPTKLSLGIPTYSGYWYTDASQTDPSKRVHVITSDISYDQVDYLLKKYNVKPIWDNANKVNYVFYPHNLLYEYIFIEDGQSFREKLALRDQFKLRGISVFDLGNEDPRIWDELNHINKKARS